MPEAAEKLKAVAELKAEWGEKDARDAAASAASATAAAAAAVTPEAALAGGGGGGKKEGAGVEQEDK